MGKAKNGGSGLGAKPAPAPKQSSTRAPDTHTTKEQQAAALINQGKLQQAEAIYRELITAGTRNHIVYGNLGAVLQMLNRHSESMQFLAEAVDINKNFADAHYNLGNAHHATGSAQAAKEHYQIATKQNPKHHKAFNNLGNLLTEEGDTQNALALLQEALRLNPNYPEALNNLGNALRASGDLDGSITSYKKAIELRPEFADAYNHLGAALQEAGKVDDAIAYYRKALDERPGYADAHLNLSVAELLTGEYRTGFARYESRFHSIKGRSILSANPTCQALNGCELHTSKQLLLVSEQGLGDTLQFMRYTISLRHRGISVSICAQPKLHKLIQASDIDPSPLTPEQADATTEGFWIPLLSIPRHLQVSPENPIITDPYIKIADELTSKWQGILASDQRPIIGINWQGNPKTEKTNLRGRSMPLEAFAPVTTNSQISLLSLQKGFGSEQLETCSFRDRFVSCQPLVDDTWDFLETAAIIANCDLVITSDTAVAHLAGGMGKTTWLLLHHVPDWRWGLVGETTFWYPSMRLFRQTERGNWDEVLQRVAEALRHELAGLSF